jgi:lysophospholipase
MAYTAAGLSFMIENLGKTIILTGSQIPLAVRRNLQTDTCRNQPVALYMLLRLQMEPNDAAQNLLGAITIAGHFEIPEVCLFFDNKLMRGNRTRKTDALGFSAFSSNNFPELAKVGSGSISASVVPSTYIFVT